MKKVFKIPLAGMSFILFLATLLLYLYFFTIVPEQRLNDWLEYYFQDKIGYKLTIEKINRDLWGRVRIDGIEIYFNADEESASINVGAIKSIRADYSLKNILLQNFTFSNFEIIDFNLSLLPDVTPKGLFSSEEKQYPLNEKSLPRINFEKIRLENITLKTILAGDIIDINIDELTGSFKTEGNLILLNLDSLTGACPDKNLTITKLDGTFAMVDNSLKLESMNLRTRDSDIYISGSIDKLSDPQFELAFNFKPLDLKDIKNVSGVNLDGIFQAEGDFIGTIKKFSGKITGTGNLFGRALDDFTADYRFESNKLYFDSYTGFVFKSPTKGKGFLDFNASPEIYGYKGTLNDLNLQNIGVDLYSAFTGKVDIKGEGLSEKNFHMNIDMELSRADIDIYHFHQAYGEVDFDLDYLIFQPGFRANYKNTWIEYEGILEYTGLIDITGNVLFDDLSDFTGQIFITDLDGVGRADFAVTGPTQDFTINGNFDSDSCRFYGLTVDTLSFDVDLKSFISHQVGKVEGYWKGGDIYSVPVDSGLFSVLVSGNKYFLDRIYCQNENNQMSMFGAYDNTIIPPNLVIDTLNVILWKDTVSNIAPLMIDVFDKEVEFKDFRLHSRESTLDMAGTVTYDGEMDLEINTDELEIQPFMNYFISDPAISSILSGNIKVGGDFDLPQFKAYFIFSDLTVDNEDIGKFYINAEYDDSKFTFLPAELESERALYTLTGTIPLNLSFTSEEPRLPERPINAKFVAAGTSIELVPIFVPTVEYIDADFNVDIAFTGTYKNPIVNGIFIINSGTLKAVELRNPIKIISINGYMENDLIFIDSLLGVVTPVNGKLTMKSKFRDKEQIFLPGEPGVISGDGRIKLLGLGLFDYNIDIYGNACEFYTDAYDILGQADMALTVTGSSPPLVSGNLQLSKLEMREPFITFSTGVTEESEVLEDSTAWDIKIEVSATNNLWIKNAENVIELEGAADMELKGDVSVTREKGIYNTLGQLDVLRGYFYLGNLKFKVESGTMIFDKPDTLDPSINFNATTKVSGGLFFNQSSDVTDLNLLIRGTLLKPQIESAEGSEYSSETIMEILLPGIVTGGGAISSTEAMLVKQLGDIFAKPIIGTGFIDEIDLNPYDRDSENSEDTTATRTRISVAKYISPKLFLRYSRRISQDAEQTFGIEYFFNNNLSFEGRQGTKYEGVSFDLKYRYEF